MALAALARRQSGRGGRRFGAGDAARRPRRLAVLRRQRHHPGDLGAVGDRGPLGPRARAGPPRRPDRRRPSSRSCSPSSASAPTWSAGSSARSWSCGSRCSPCSAAAPGRRATPPSCAGSPRTTPCCSWWTTPSSPSSRWVPSSCRSPAPRPCMPTWATSARPRSGGPGSSSSSRALTLNYLGQGALILEAARHGGRNPFFLLAPDCARFPLVVLATLATVIASQAVISGAYSVSRQAERLGYLPRLTVRHTSRHERGQIYVPAVNWTLFVGVMLLLVAFRSSARLATAYGLAVTGTFLITTTALPHPRRVGLGLEPWQLALLGVAAGGARADLLRRQPHQGRPRRLAAPAHRRSSSPPSCSPGSAGAPWSPSAAPRWRGRCRRSSTGCTATRSPRCPAPPSSCTRTRTRRRWPCARTPTFNHVIHEHVLIVSTTRSANVPVRRPTTTGSSRPPRRPVRRDRPT